MSVQMPANCYKLTVAFRGEKNGFTETSYINISTANQDSFSALLNTYVAARRKVLLPDVTLQWCRISTPKPGFAKLAFKQAYNGPGLLVANPGENSMPLNVALLLRYNNTSILGQLFFATNHYLGGIPSRIVKTQDTIDTITTGFLAAAQDLFTWLKTNCVQISFRTVGGNRVGTAHGIGDVQILRLCDRDRGRFIDSPHGTHAA